MGRQRWALLLILLVAAAFRLAVLGASPPGINQDEALSAWNGWCLLKTGHALSGEPWPIFHCRNIGDYPTMLFFYVLMPFQQLFGLSVWSTRLPAALAGVASVALAWDIGRRVAGPGAGLLSAAALAVAPWSIFLGRFGTGASLGPLQALLPLSMLARSGLVPALGPGAERGRVTWAAAAGLAFGVGTYGFHSLRIQLPLTLAVLAALEPRATQAALRDPAGRRSLAALATGFLVPFVPMAVVSFTDPNSLERWRTTRLWPSGTSWPIIARLVAERWLIHFSPDFLFIRGDRYSMLNPARAGALAWWMLPGLLTGLGALVAGVRRSGGARLLLALLLLYPVGDLVSANDGVHSLRSSPGLPALALAVGFGWDWLLQRMHGRLRSYRVPVFTLGALLMCIEAARFGVRLFRDATSDLQTQIEYQAALLEAGQWLAPRLSPGTPVYCTTTGMNQPFVILLMGLKYDAGRWLRDTKDVDRRGTFDQCRSFGDVNFMFDEAAITRLRRLQDDGVPERVWFVTRPNELSIQTPDLRLRAPGGQEVLWITARDL